MQVRSLLDVLKEERNRLRTEIAFLGNDEDFGGPDTKARRDQLVRELHEVNEAIKNAST